MNKLLPIALLFALTACASAPASPAPTPSPEPTAVPVRAAEPTAAPDTAFPVGNLMRLPSDWYSGVTWNTGDALYELQAEINTTAARILETDYTTLQQTVYCHIPGCTHDSDSCPAYLPMSYCTSVVAVDGAVYTYPTELTNVAPTTIDRIDPDSGKTPVAAVPDELPHMMLQWCDEYAFYSSYGEAHKPGTLYRWDWHNGTVQTIPLLADESIIACEGSRFLTIRIVVDEQWPAFGGTEQDDAIMQHAEYEYNWLDPATGARERLCTRPCTDGYFFYYCDGKIYYSGNFRNPDTDAQQYDILYFDTADGEEKTLLPDSPPYVLYRLESFLPAFSGRQPQFAGVQELFSQPLELLDAETGRVYSMPTVNGCTARVAACTSAGQWVAVFNPQESTDPDHREYVLYEPSAYLAGLEPTALFAMYNGEKD